ncbi:MAG: DUF1826 domain-containing protein [Pseudomonadota bacterium]
MNVVRDLATIEAVGIEIAGARDGLAAIQQPGCAAVVWRRQTDPGFQAWIDALPPDLIPRARIILRPEELQDALLELCDEQGVPDGAERAWLLQDIEGLTRTFLKLVPAPFLRLRLEAVSTNRCRKFHVDTVTARLLCTYRGTGTQYGISADGAEPRLIVTVPTGAPIVLRGTLWPEAPRSGLVHRSPPIEGTGQTRFVLVIDPITDPDEEY